MRSKTFRNTLQGPVVVSHWVNRFLASVKWARQPRRDHTTQLPL